MENEKQKPKISHFILLTKENDEEIKRYQVKPVVLWIGIVVFCVIVGVILGYISYEERIWQAMDKRSDEQVALIKELEETNNRLMEEKVRLESEISGLNETVQILSDTVSVKTESENELKAILEKQCLPTEFPLSGSASMKEKEMDGHPICLFHSSIGGAVVATASGKVTSIKDDADFVHSIWIDHGNGYITVYRNAGKPRVSEGNTVSYGTTLYIIEEKKEDVGYQMMKDGAYINPMDMLKING